MTMLLRYTEHITYVYEGKLICFKKSMKSIEYVLGAHSKWTRPTTSLCEQKVITHKMEKFLKAKWFENGFD